MDIASKIVEFVGTGRRKCAVATVRLRPGSGKVDVNGRDFDEYFPLASQRDLILEPLRLIGKMTNYDLLIRSRGGGIEGQATATRLGLSRALVEENDTLRVTFKAEGLMTRDPRKKERKKYGKKKARKSFQFSKR